jgi:flagellin
MPTLQSNPLLANLLLERPGDVGSRKQVERAAAKLSSGYRINAAQDDAASLAVANAIEARRRSSSVADRNIGDAISMVQTASGALDGVSDIVSRMRELATQSANGALSDGDRASIQAEFASLAKEAGRAQEGASFNGKPLLRDPSRVGGPGQPTSTGETFQVGEAAEDTRTVDFSAPTIATGNVSTQADARAAMDALDGSLKSISERQSYFGATLNGFDAVASNARTSRVGMAGAESRLRDADMAEAASTFASNRIVSEAKIAILAQGIKASEYVLGLIKT